MMGKAESIESGSSAGSGGVSKQQLVQRTPANDASKMLEAALQQMDGIISEQEERETIYERLQIIFPRPPKVDLFRILVKPIGPLLSSIGVTIILMTRWWWFRACNNPSPHENGSLPSSTPDGSDTKTTCVTNNKSAPSIDVHGQIITSSSVLSAAQTLANVLQQSGNITPAPDPLTAGVINTWLDTHLPRQDTDERLKRLQNDKESLALQVQVLSEQVAAQSEKINDLERMLNEKTQLLNNADDLLHREMLSRSSLETQKLELMSAMSELKLQQAALERENLEMRTSHLNNNSIMTRRPPLAPVRILGTPSYSSTPHTVNTSGSGLNSTPLGGSHGNLQQSSSSPITPKTPPSSYRRQIDLHYNSLPRQSFATSTNISIPSSSSSGLSSSLLPSLGSGITASPPQPQQIGTVDNNANPKQRNVAFGKNLDHLPSSSTPSIHNVYHHQLVLYQPTQLKGFQKQRGFSVPNLAETEKVIEDTTDMPRSYTPQPSPSPSMSQKSKGLRSIFGKIKRSNSGNLEDLPGEGEFKRGGFRSTAGARLGWNNTTKPDRPFKEWDIDEICAWLDDLGLGIHEEEARKWLKNGASDLISASPVDIEKELNLKNPLHRKKIVLALADISGQETNELFKNAGKLDTAWIMRWLDDIGLPQHKDTFSLARIDGRVLHKLTMEDLATLHVTSCLHAASLRRAIQLMREQNWDADCLIRRSGGEIMGPPYKVSLWTAHRVMEWLRVVDLAEYAPNLRGAGVHGALMTYEPKFNSELLADLLSIPPSKTLLRRHLATHFKDLLGRDAIQNKRDAENVLGYQPLTLTAKIKTPKKTQFSLKRKKSSKSAGDEWSDFVCPMGPSGDHLLSTSNQTSVSTTNPIALETAAGSEAVSHQPNNNDSPTSSRSSASNS